MRRNTLLAVAVGLATFGARLFAGELPWQFDYDKALDEAKTRHREVLLDFSATWCGPCRMLETTTFADDKVQRLMGGYVLVKIDIDRSPMLAARYRVRAVPTCIVLNEFGEVVDKHTGYADPEGFSEWLSSSENADRATSAQPESQFVAERIKALGTVLESSDPGARDKAVANLLDIYCAPRADDAGPAAGDADPPAPPAQTPGLVATDDGVGAKLAEQALRDFTRKHAASAAKYLAERRLAVRILFARLFAEKSGAALPFDPWAPASARAAAAAAWERQVVGP